jgi:hypothetical protein
MFALLSGRVVLRLGTRFAHSIGGTNLLPRPGWIDRSGCRTAEGLELRIAAATAMCRAFTGRLPSSCDSASVVR